MFSGSVIFASNAWGQPSEFKMPHSDRLRAYSKALRINVLAYFAAALETKEKGL
jgi:hypothetical protein